MHTKDRNDGRRSDEADAKQAENISWEDDPITVVKAVNKLLSGHGLEIVALGDGVDFDLWVEKKS